MLQYETKKLEVSKELKKKIDIALSFAEVKDYELISGEIKAVKSTNLGFVRPHILKIKGTDYLIFENSKIVFINGYKDKIKFSELSEYIRNH